VGIILEVMRIAFMFCNDATNEFLVILKRIRCVGLNRPDYYYFFLEKSKQFL